MLARIRFAVTALGHETLIPVPVPSLGFQFPVQGTHTLFVARRPHNNLSRSRVGSFVNSVQSSCRQFTKRPAQFTKPPTTTVVSVFQVSQTGDWGDIQAIQTVVMRTRVPGFLD